MLTVMVKHVMSSTELMQSQQTPYSSPSVCNNYLSANGMESQLELSLNKLDKIMQNV